MLHVMQTLGHNAQCSPALTAGWPNGFPFYLNAAPPPEGFYIAHQLDQLRATDLPECFLDDRTYEQPVRSRLESEAR